MLIDAFSHRTSQALRYLGDQSKNTKFLLVVEGSRIDMAGHNNDPVGHVSDMLAYLETVRFVKEYVDEQNAGGMPTLLVSVSDHETGGLSLGRQLTTKYPEYACESFRPSTSPFRKMLTFALASLVRLPRSPPSSASYFHTLLLLISTGYPDALLNATHSTEHLGAVVAANSSVTREWLRSEIYGKGLGITDVEDKEIDQLWPHRQNAYWSNRVLADAVSRPSLVSSSPKSRADFPYHHRSPVELKSDGQAQAIPASTSICTPTASTRQASPATGRTPRSASI